MKPIVLATVLALTSALPVGAHTIPGLTITLVPISPGNFVMGSPEDEEGRHSSEGPQTKVILTRRYWLAQTEVTQQQWKALMGTDVLDQARKMLADDELYSLGGRDQTVRDRIGIAKTADPHDAIGNVGDTLPMYWVNWFEAVAFCDRLNARERAAGRLPKGYQYRLPTEAEWEYAARAGTATATYAGDMKIKAVRDAPVLEDIAWYAGNSSVGYTGKGWDTKDWVGKSSPGGDAGPRAVATKKPNGFGLYDMLGNVNEWCFDRYSDRLPGGELQDTTGPVEGDLQVIKGGSWFNPALSSRAADRDWSKPGRRFFGLGFRVTLAPILKSDDGQPRR